MVKLVKLLSRFILLAVVAHVGVHAECGIPGLADAHAASEGCQVVQPPAVPVPVEDPVFGHPCYKGDRVTLQIETNFDGLVIAKDTDLGTISDNMGAHGEAPLNVQWDKDTSSPRRVYQVSYEVLSDNSCMDSMRAEHCAPGGKCDGAARNEIKDGYVCKCAGASAPIGISSRFGGEGKCYEKSKGDIVIDGSGKQHVCSGRAQKKCGGTGKNCAGMGFGNSKKNNAPRWPRYSAYDELQYPSPR